MLWTNKHALTEDTAYHYHRKMHIISQTVLKLTSDYSTNKNMCGPGYPTYIKFYPLPLNTEVGRLGE